MSGGLNRQVLRSAERHNLKLDVLCRGNGSLLMEDKSSGVEAVLEAEDFLFLYDENICLDVSPVWSN